MRVRLACSDPSGLTVHYALRRGAWHGSLSSFGQSQGELIYAPRAGFVGHDSFVYRAYGADGASKTIKVSVAVSAVRPVLSQVWLQRRRFEAAAGTRLHFRLSRGAAITIAITNPEGRQVAERTLRHEVAGANSLWLSGRFGSGTLAPGGYAVRLVASNGGGRSTPSARSFTIVATSGITRSRR